jgi:hypothetical protein
VDHLVAAHAEELELLRDLVAGAPAGRSALDHVAATPETALRRALYLGTRFSLGGTRLLCLGDHDLTGLATALLYPDAEVAVVDVDDRILDYIDDQARRLGLRIQCRHADLRLGLAPSLAGWADLVFTDPPYTPEGVALFCDRALQALRARVHGRVLLAYGYGETLPGLGARVQAALSAHRLVYEAILPGVNSYTGAEAIGAASDLYVLRPTAETWRRSAPRGDRPAHRMYTHGPQAVESAGETVDASVEVDLIRRYQPRVWVGEPPGGAAEDSVPRIGLATWLSAPHPEEPAVINLAGGFEAILPRVLLASPGTRTVVLLDNSAAQLRSAAGQHELADALAPFWRLRFVRSAPAPKLAIVEAERVGPSDPPDGNEPGTEVAVVLARLQARAHGKLANTAREALIEIAHRRGGPPLTKNDARRILAATPSVAGGATLLELPTGQLRALPRVAAQWISLLP